MIPEDLLYSEQHEWVRFEPDGVAVVGITDHAQMELGDIVYVELPGENDTCEDDDVIGSVESVKAVSELYSPVAGTVVEVNQELEASPERVNEDPYGEGWMIRVRLSDPEGSREGLMGPAEYQAFTEPPAA